MSYNYDYLYDDDFLKIIDNMRIKEQFLKITALDFKTERPLESIEGKAISGNLTLDGKSSVRRTCNLTMFLDKTNKQILNVDNIISINKKIEILIGFTNTTSYYKDYDIIWFPLGIFLIINPNISRSAQGLTVSLQLKDKMCLLNGECGGIIPASTTFHEIEIEDDSNNITVEYPTIFQIIQELVHHLGGEELHKIIISDIDQTIKQPYRWIGEIPIWINKQGNYIISESEPSEEGYIKYEYGRSIGYKNIDFTYPGELICNAGDTICSVLDKIKNVLGNYEYFYDINGNFIFQEIKNYLNTTQAKVTMDLIKNDSLLQDNYKIDITKGKAAYVFNNANLISAYSMTPSYNNIKNDFIVWGMKTTSSGSSYPIRFHLAIDDKPFIKNNYEYKVFPYLDDYDLENEKYSLNFSFNSIVSINKSKAIKKKINLDSNLIISELNCLEWAIGIGNECGLNNIKNKKIDLNFSKFYNKIYDFNLLDKNTYSSDIQIDSKFKTKYKYYFREKFNLTLSKEEILNIALGIANIEEDKKILGETIIVNLFYDINEEYKKFTSQHNFLEIIYPIAKDFQGSKKITPKDWRTKLYLDGLQSEEILGEYSNNYYVELKNEWPKIYDILNGKYIDEETIAMDYYLDFIDSSSDIGDLSISNIGKRTKVISNDKINCLFEPDAPEDIVLIEAGSDNAAQERFEAIKNRQSFMQVSTEVINSIASGTYYQSAYDEVKNLLQQHTAYNESITLTAIPIYHLEPNIRITVEDEESGIGGDYMINRISLPLDVNGNMTINASKAIERY